MNDINTNRNAVDDLLDWYTNQYKTTATTTKAQKSLLSFKLNLNTVQRAVRDQKLIIGTVNKSTGTFSVSENPVVHFTAADADVEAKRLAGLDSTKIFIVLKLTNGFQNVVVQNVETLH